MSTVNVEESGNIAIVKLNLGVTNPVGPALVNDLSAVLDDLAGRVNGMVLAGGEKFFSIGLNLPELVQLDRGGMADFWRRFIGVTLKLYTLPLVTVAAIEGHAPAAGTIFGLACDYRFVAEGRKLLGLNEIRLGIPVPYVADLMLRQIVGDRFATDLLYHGEFLTPDKALEIGMIDEIVPGGTLLERAVEKVSGIAGFENAAFDAIKKTRTADIRIKYQQNAETVNAAFLDCWFAESTRKRLLEAAAKF